SPVSPPGDGPACRIRLGASGESARWRLCGEGEVASPRSQSDCRQEKPCLGAVFIAIRQRDAATMQGRDLAYEAQAKSTAARAVGTRQGIEALEDPLAGVVWDTRPVVGDHDAGLVAFLHDLD